VVPRDNFALDREIIAYDRLTPRALVPAPERGRLPFEALDAPGRLYRTLLVNPRIQMPRLVGDLERSQVRFVQRRFDGMEALLALPEPVIVHCTGLGAGALVGDARMIGQRGHLVRLQRTHPELDWLFGGGCENGVISYVFCRQDDIVVGGTWVSGDTRAGFHRSDELACIEVLTNAARMFHGRISDCASPLP
jgi:hypothetical protein